MISSDCKVTRCGERRGGDRPKAGLLGSHLPWSQVATNWHPAGGGNALHFGDDRLRNGLDLHHELGRDVEDAAVLVDIPPVISERSWPEQKTFPAAARITARFPVAADLIQNSQSVPASDRVRARCGAAAVQGHDRGRPAVLY